MRVSCRTGTTTGTTMVTRVGAKESGAAEPEPEPDGVGHWSLSTLREKFVKIGAKVVRHGRYITFQISEVALPRILFVEIPRLNDGLRPAPLPR